MPAPAGGRGLWLGDAQLARPGRRVFAASPWAGASGWPWPWPTQRGRPGLEFHHIPKTMKHIKMVTGTATSAVLAWLRPVLDLDSGDSVGGLFASRLTCSPVDLPMPRSGPTRAPVGRLSQQAQWGASSTASSWVPHPGQSVGQDVRSWAPSASMEVPMSVMVSPTAAICAPVDSISSSPSTVTRMSWSETIRSLTSGW